MEKVLRGVIATIVLTSSVVSNAAFAVTPSFVGYPAPGGTTASGSGSGPTAAGGRTWSYSGFNPSAYGDLYYTIGSYTTGFNLGAPILSADGTNQALSFNAGLSSLLGGVAVWTGSTNVPGYSSYYGSVLTEFRLSVTDSSNNAIALLDPTVIGLPSSAGAVLNVTGDFKATWEFLISTNGGVSYSAALPTYNSLPYKTPGNVLVSNVGGAFYATAPVPEADTYAMMMAGLALVGVAARRRKHTQV